MGRKTDRRMARQTDDQTDKWPDRRMARQTDRVTLCSAYQWQTRSLGWWYRYTQQREQNDRQTESRMMTITSAHLGSRWKKNFVDPTCTVWPALLPPWADQTDSGQRQIGRQIDRTRVILSSISRLPMYAYSYIIIYATILHDPGHLLL